MKTFRQIIRRLLAVPAIFLFLSSPLLAQETNELLDMSLEDLMNMEVTTASNTGEKLSKAPATIIVITDQDIADRGYMEFYDVLNDLPGFDLSRGFGDDEYYLYARGYRKTVSDQMILMIDGMNMNHLWSNNMLAFAQYPISNIKQIEVVYGPASAVYGPNAFAGVINIITKKAEKSTISLSSGVNNTTIADMNINAKAGDINFNITGRVFNSDGYDLSNRQPYINSSIYNDPKVWGPFINTDLSGYQSPRYNYYLQGEAETAGLTLGVINWSQQTGQGNVYPGDKALNKELWKYEETAIYARYETMIEDKLSSKSQIRFRTDGISSSSLFIERNPNKGNFGYNVSAGSYQSTNKSISVFQDFGYSILNNLFINFGAKYEYRYLQKGYDLNYGASMDASNDSVAYPINDIPISPSVMYQGDHFTLEDKGVYAQLKYTAFEGFDFVGGLRYDYNSIQKEVISPRLGIVYEPMKNLITKVFYGTAFLEPSARSLYGGWNGNISSITLKPEKMQTLEASVAYTIGASSNGLNLYYNMGTDAIGVVDGKNVNIGERRMIGVEVYSKWLFKDVASYLYQLKIDGYLSYLKSEEDLTNSGTFTETGSMAPIKLHAVVTANFTKDLSLSLQGRYIDKINTVSSNPLGTIDSWFSTDIFVAYKNFLFQGITIGLKVYNLLDVKYDHPGYRDGSAGENAYDANGNLLDSKGWYNSRLPQPEREIRAVLKLEL